MQSARELTKKEKKNELDGCNATNSWNWEQNPSKRKR